MKVKQNYSADDNAYMESAATNRLLYLDKKRSPMLLPGVKGANSLTAITEESFANNIRDFMANVNRKSSRQKNMTSEGEATEPEWKKKLREFSEDRYAVDDISPEEIEAIQSIGRKSVNEFTSAEIARTERFARRYWRDMGTKSPFFRAWFGDWRAYDTTPVAAVNISATGGEKNFSAGKTTNIDTHTVVSWGSDFIRETKKHQRSGGIASTIAGNIESIVENAVLLDSATSELSSKTKMPGTAMMHSFYAVVNIDGENHILKLYAEEAIPMKNGNPVNGKPPFVRAYELKDIIKVATPANGVHSIDGGLTEADVTTVDNVADLFNAVKDKDKSFNPKPVSPVLLNDDGTPKVFYHGTGADFTTFSTDEIDPREGSFFFAENKEDAQAYGENVLEVYLRGENLADYDSQPSEFYSLKTKRDQVRWLKQRSYDGWYADMDSDGWGEISVFSPEQIKSTTGNTGTFDTENPDIRYSADELLVEGEAAEPEWKKKTGAAASSARASGKPLKEKSVMQTAATSKNGASDRTSASSSAGSISDTNYKIKDSYSIDEEYERKIDVWDKAGRPEGDVFTLGETGEALQGLGAMEQEIYINSAYTKSNAVNTIPRSEVLYADEKRSITLLRSIGLTIASRPLLHDAYIGNIAYSEDSVKIEGTLFEEVFGKDAYSADELLIEGEATEPEWKRKLRELNPPVSIR